MKTALISLLVGLLAGAALLYFCWARPALNREPEVIVKTDTLVVRDTVTMTELVPVIRRVTDTVRVEVQTIQHDTVSVLLPREEVVYQDTSYYAVISGFQPRLDTLSVYPETRTIYIEKTIREPTKHWGLGIQGGVGAGISGFTPYIGIGVSYNLLSW